MEKTLNLALNNYDPTPHSLRADPSVNLPASTISVNLAALYHHYYLDSFGTAPPDPDPVKFEPTQFLLSGREFRFQGRGLGTSPAIRRHRSTELGQAFCRLFLYEHVGLTYFAHTETLLGRQLLRPFPGGRLERAGPGDTADYLCLDGAGHLCLAEAKGRHSAVSFFNKEFQTWRDQFARVVVKDDAGEPRSVKGHIVATRFATEENSDRLKSTIFAEDPSSPGRLPLAQESAQVLGRVIRGTHYSGIAIKLRQPVLAGALATGVAMAEELRVIATAWRIVDGPLRGQRFVGGYFGVAGGGPILKQVEGRLVFLPTDPLRLDLPSFTFFGLEEGIFRQLVEQARQGDTADIGFRQFDLTDFFYSGFSVLRDGSALGPLEFFVPDEQITV